MGSKPPEGDVIEIAANQGQRPDKYLISLAQQLGERTHHLPVHACPSFAPGVSSSSRVMYPCLSSESGFASSDRIWATSD